jgi:hypothetical protein
VSRAAACLAALLLALPAAAQSDEEIRKAIVQDSLARFIGYCPCPYSYDRGQQCADQSVYSRRADPWLRCYPQDVTWQEIRDYRDRMGSTPSPYRRYR